MILGKGDESSDVVTYRATLDGKVDVVVKYHKLSKGAPFPRFPPPLSGFHSPVNSADSETPNSYLHRNSDNMSPALLDVAASARPVLPQPVLLSLIGISALNFCPAILPFLPMLNCPRNPFGRDICRLFSALQNPN